MSWQYSRWTCPYNKRYQLIEWACGKWPDDKAKFKQMTKKQLYAIWYSLP